MCHGDDSGSFRGQQGRVNLLWRVTSRFPVRSL